MSAKFTVVLEQVADAAVRVGRDPGSIRIVGVAKRQPNERIVSAVLQGLEEIGENRLQEAMQKRPVVEGLLKKADFNPARLKWHMVGRLQSNKAARAAQLFEVIQSVESVKVAKILSRTAGDFDKSLEVFIEVNVSGEATKGGVQPDELASLVDEIHSLPNLRLNGLMTLGPLTDDTLRIRAAFDRLSDLREEMRRVYPELTLKWELSMGMSGDFTAAIAAGATIVRIGTAIFGPRHEEGFL